MEVQPSRTHDLALARERDRRRLRDLVAVALTVGFLGGGFLACAWLQAELLRTAYRIDELEKRQKELEGTEQQLLLEASYLASPEQIDRRAREELGMEPADPGRIVFLERP